jgi:hypothetical protein
VFLDGAHTWPIDALAFLLLDRLLTPGGYIWLDDLEWSLAGSRSFDNSIWATSCYTAEQMRRFQVGMIVDKLIRSDKQYKQVGECVWQRTGSGT